MRLCSHASNLDNSSKLDPRRLICVAVILLSLASTTGCSTLASLGLPFGSVAHPILDRAKEISEAPGQALQLPRELETQPLDQYLVEIGDTIFIETVSFDATIRLPGDQVVKPDGTISIGEYGSLMVVKKTIEQIELEIQSTIDAKTRQQLEDEFAQEQQRDRQSRELRASLENGDSDPSRPTIEIENAADTLDGQNLDADLIRQREYRLALDRRIEDRIAGNRISVRLVNWDSKRFYVLGEVNSPGYFAYTGNQTVLDAILQAGGLSTKANHHQIIVSRPTPCGSCRIVMKICYDQIVQLGDASTNYQLRPGDRVFVPSLKFIDDVRKTLSFGKSDSCSRCASCQQGCELPAGCGQLDLQVIESSLPMAIIQN